MPILHFRSFCFLDQFNCGVSGIRDRVLIRWKRCLKFKCYARKTFKIASVEAGTTSEWNCHLKVSSSHN